MLWSIIVQPFMMTTPTINIGIKKNSLYVNFTFLLIEKINIQNNLGSTTNTSFVGYKKDSYFILIES